MKDIRKWQTKHISIDRSPSTDDYYLMVHTAIPISRQEIASTKDEWEFVSLFNSKLEELKQFVIEEIERTKQNGEGEG